jgi:hypothetical protein
MHHRVVMRPLDNEETRKPAFNARQRMVDQREAAGAWNIEVNNGRTAGRHGHRLHSGQGRRAETCAFMDVIENLADHVEGRGEIRAAGAKENADRLADAGAQRMFSTGPMEFFDASLLDGTPCSAQRLSPRSRRPAPSPDLQ